MKVLVTGGQGFLGKHLVTLLRKEGKEVVSLDINDSLCGGEGVPDEVCDVRDFEKLKNTLKERKISHIVHLAAYGRNLTCRDFPTDAREVNEKGTKNIFEAARSLSIERVVFCSSNITLSPEKTVYKETKEVGERLVSFFSSLGLSCLGLRPSNIYGKGQSKIEYQPCAFAGLDKWYSELGVFTVTGDGTQSRDWIHAYDVSRAFSLALCSDVRGKTLDVCTGKLTSINHIAKTLKVNIRYVSPREGDAQTLVSDPVPAKKILGFESRIKLEDALEDAFPEVVKRRQRNP